MAHPFTEKVSEKEKPESTQYTCHRYDHRNESPLSALKGRFHHLPYYIIVSVDPAIDNLGFYVEKRYATGQVETLAMEKGKFKADTDPNTCSSLYLEVMMFLDKYRHLYTECHFIIIERQFKYQSARVMQQVIAYFMSLARNLVNLPFIVEIDSKVRLKQLKCPPGMNRPYQKKWIVEKVYWYLRQRGDQQALTFLDSMTTKKDDVCDAVAQVEAFCILVQALPLTRVNASQIFGQLSSGVQTGYYPGQYGQGLPPTAYPASYLTPVNNTGNTVIVMEDDISYF